MLSVYILVYKLISFKKLKILSIATLDLTYDVSAIFSIVVNNNEK
jgi:hypothetical protein